MLRKIALIVVLLAAVPAWAQGPGEGEKLNTLVEKYWDELEELNPLVATFNGNNKYNDRLAISIGPEHLAQQLALEKKYLAAVDALDASKLSGQDRISHAIFRR